MAVPTWQQVCELAGSGVVPIKIELQNGLTIQGRINIEDAKKVFREPNDLATPISSGASGVEVVVVLPMSKVKMVAFPHWLGAQAN